MFKFAVRSVPSVIDAALARAGLGKEAVDWLVMHQVGQRSGVRIPGCAVLMIDVYICIAGS